MGSGGLGNRLLQAIEPPAGEYDVPTVRKQRHGSGLADASPGTGNDSYFL